MRRRGGVAKNAAALSVFMGVAASVADSHIFGHNFLYKRSFTCHYRVQCSA
jgi:hypothetical protein